MDVGTYLERYVGMEALQLSYIPPRIGNNYDTLCKMYIYTLIK